MSTSGSPGFVQHDGVRIVEVSGSDARRWLNDLVTGPVGSLAPGDAARSLVLTPTGRIRADFTVVERHGGLPLVLVQHVRQPEAVDVLLEPYVLSSDVALTDATDRLVLFSVPGVDVAPDLPPAARLFAPSVLGPGIGILVERSAASDVASSLSAAMAPATSAALERFRVGSGVPLYGIDFDAGALPAEAGLESAIDFAKGCFLGQESVAKIRNLGHPQTILVALCAGTAVAPGDGVYAHGTKIGNVTSAVARRDGAVVLARVRWDVDGRDLATRDGVRFERSVNGL
jgi:folate-binding protein YgfZ